MIVELNISNFAIIDNLRIDFTEGFNVLTGETGAGKSIIVEGINLILGQRASKDYIRKGSTKATLEGLFYVRGSVSDNINLILEEYGIDIDPADYLLISREIYSNGRSISRVNGRTVTLIMLNRITANLVDIYGQHEHQSLLDVDNHIRIVDSFGDTELKRLLNKFREKYELLKEEQKRLNELTIDDIEKDREMDLLRYQVDEIDGAALTDYDEKDIFMEYEKLSNIQKIQFELGQVIDMIDNDDYNKKSIIDDINICISNMQDIDQYDTELKEYSKILADINFQFQDIFMDMRNYLERLAIDTERLNFLEERIDTIGKLKRKYGNTIGEILEYRDRIKDRLNDLLDYEDLVMTITRRIDAIEGELNNYCSRITEIRMALGGDIERSIMDELDELNMNNVVFKIDINELDDFSHNGKDKVNFLISTNKGEDLKPLSRIVSGGEMSRIMLAFKNILAKYEGVPCLIFDEIDAGISGRTAQVVGEKIEQLSHHHQIICVSHLPQIAALADTHFVIEKKIYEDKTSTVVKRLGEDERVNEMARLLGGVDLTDTTTLHAKEMLEMSKILKKMD
ncbi:MAG: DNA repair protein RecN [Tissierellia bacterium]|nr:DNA repair protein RecN [Tissierellia bacterium]